jgi:hypothetical protein
MSHELQEEDGDGEGDRDGDVGANRVRCTPVFCETNITGVN